MRHPRSFLIVLACFVALFLACFYPVLIQGRQFGFRDAAHYYYPLYQRVQQEWDAGRIPLWEIEENAGMPLLGNPTAAVLYPLKAIYALVPYAWGTRLYTLAHTTLAFGAMIVLMRSWGTSWAGSGLAASSYTFGAPVLFQSSNIIYLVGAAWLPLGIHAIDRWVRLGHRWGLLELAVVLSMQVLGGEPQSAYLLGLAGLGYAAGLAWQRASASRETAVRSTSRWFRVLAILGLLVFWVVATIALGCWLPRFRPHEMPAVPLPWGPWIPTAVAGAWGIVGLAILRNWRRRGWNWPFGLACLGLLGAASLATALSAAQLLPVIEFTQRTARVAEGGTHEIYPFSMEPARLAGLVWPEVLGDAFDDNTSWAEAVRPPGGVPHVWVPSLYLGALTIVLAMGALALRRGTPWRVWLSVLVIVGTLGSLGLYTSPIWAVRALAEGKRPASRHLLDRRPGPREIAIDMNKVAPSLRPLIRELGPLDTEESNPIRADDFLRDGDGGVYWLMTTLLPGFRQFRYPAKLFTLTSLGLAALAGIGWDLLGRGGSRRVMIVTALLTAISLALLAGVVARRTSIIAAIGSADIGTINGPVDPEGAYRALRGGLLQGAIVMGLGMLAFRMAARGHRMAGLAAMLITTIDLAAANSHLAITVPQSVFEEKPEILRIIEEAEQADPAPGPYRIHRLPSWEPPYWRSHGSPDRLREVVQWERGTLQPKYGIPLGVEYAHVLGVAELYDYEWFYGGFPWTVRDPDIAHLLNIKVGDRVVYFPRRTFDLWNVRYFVVPMWPNGWTDSFRGYASMLLESGTVYPDFRSLEEPEKTEVAREWTEKHDYRILRNRRKHPRAWVVHSARSIPPITGMRSDDERQKVMREIDFEDDPIWSEKNRPVFDPYQIVWIDRDKLDELTGCFSGKAPDASEAVTVRYPSSQRVELDVEMKSPGMVVLADVYYPGWELTINGEPAPFYQANRGMRGAALKSGPHHLVYTYNPRSFRFGLIGTALGLMILIASGVACYLRPLERTIAETNGPAPPEADHE